ncbi:SAM-dependent methyltransferase [Arthrobacter glacialis]|nr:SAM-dependent methyltransferase [Arthrobacter glacialis]
MASVEYMTTHGHHQHGHDNHNGHSHGAGLAESLTLDALILGTYLEQATALAAELTPTPGVIIDAGSGSGVGAVALAQRFENTHIIALDKSADMLGQTLEAASKNGLTGQVTTVLADLDEAWPEVAAADLIWASSSLHEVADPERSMGEMFAGLNAGGLLMVIEMDGLPCFLSAATLADGTELAALEARLHAALAQMRWNHHPDWRAGLERAGFDVVEQRSYTAVGNSTPDLASRYARMFLERIRTAMDDVATAADLAILDSLLASDGPESLASRTDLQVRGSRTVWAARKP